MAKLVVLSEGLTGQSYELKVDTTTVGRVEDNTFQIPQSSVSSHHCEILLRGDEVVVKDLNSTNGTFINNQQITGEAVLKSGQILRLGQVEIRLENGAPAPAAAAAPASAPAETKRPEPATSSTIGMSRKGGVSLEQLEKGPQGGFDTKAFTKKSNKTNLWFIIGGVILLVVIVGAILVAYNQVSSSSH